MEQNRKKKEYNLSELLGEKAKVETEAKTYNGTITEVHYKGYFRLSWDNDNVSKQFHIDEIELNLYKK